MLRDNLFNTDPAEAIMIVIALLFLCSLGCIVEVHNRYTRNYTQTDGVPDIGISTGINYGRFMGVPVNRQLKRKYPQQQTDGFKIIRPSID